MSDLEARLAALEHRLGELEDINAIRRLHWAYGYYIDFNRAEDVVQLFAEDGVVVFLSGEYRGHAGVRRLYGTWFQNYFTQGVNDPVDGFLLDHFQMQDIITVAPDRRPPRTVAPTPRAGDCMSCKRTSCLFYLQKTKGTFLVPRRQ